MANIFKSKEVYRHLKYSVYDKNVIVPVQGIYVSGQYSPPYYNDPLIMINEISSEPATVADFKDVSVDTSDVMVKIVDISLRVNPITIVNYSNASVDSGIDLMTKIVDISVSFNQPSITFLQTVQQDILENDMVKLVDLSVRYSQPSIIQYSSKSKNMTPEPMLRVTTLTSTSATVEDYN